MFSKAYVGSQSSASTTYHFCTHKYLLGDEPKSKKFRYTHTIDVFSKINDLAMLNDEVKFKRNASNTNSNTHFLHTLFDWLKFT